MTAEVKDNVMVEEGKKWEFGQEVTDVFDEMLERSIPNYHDMRGLVEGIGSRYVTPGSRIIDIGCSRGQAVAPFVERFGDANDYLLLDVSEPMLEVCREKFANDKTVEVEHNDITKTIPKGGASLVLGILTVQFTPIEQRQRIISLVRESLVDGGAFMFVEKVLGDTYDMDRLLVSEYYSMKSENQYTQEQIQNKRKSLEGVLVPVTAKWNEELLVKAGFSQVECFWRYLNFAGWVAVK